MTTSEELLDAADRLTKQGQHAAAYELRSLANTLPSLTMPGAPNQEFPDCHTVGYRQVRRAIAQGERERA